MLRGGRPVGGPAPGDPGWFERSNPPWQPSTVEIGWSAERRGNADGPGGADIGDMTPASVPSWAEPTTQAGAPSRRAPVRPDSPRPSPGWDDSRPASRRAGPEPEWEPWPFPDEEPAEDEPAGPVFVDQSGRRRRMAILIGSSVAVVIVVALVMLATGLSGAAPLSIPGFPDLARPAPPPAVASTPAPDGQPGGGVGANGSSSGSTVPVVSVDPSSSLRTSQRHVPTQTPPHPTKTR